MYPSSWNSPADVIFVCRAQDNAAIKPLRSSKKITPTVQYSIVQYLLARIPSSPSSWSFLCLLRAQNQKNLMLTTCTRGGWWTIAVGWTWIYLEVIWQGLVRVRECTKLKTRFSWPLWTSSLPLFGTWWPVFLALSKLFASGLIAAGLTFQRKHHLFPCDWGSSFFGQTLRSWPCHHHQCRPHGWPHRRFQAHETSLLSWTLNQTGV